MNEEKSSIEQIIKRLLGSLSSGQRKVAEYILLNLDESALITAAQISRKVDVSEATVIRLSYSLGFNSFSEMQRLLKKRMLKKNETGHPTIQSRGEPPTNEADTIESILKGDIEILERTLTQLNYAELWKIVDQLMLADQIAVVGNNASYSAASWFYYVLDILFGNVNLYPAPGNIQTQLLKMTEKSVAVLISVQRYSYETMALAEQLKKGNVTIVGITDALLSPIGKISDYTLVTGINIGNGMISMSSVISLLNIIINGIRLKDPTQYASRIKRYEQLRSRYVDLSE